MTKFTIIKLLFHLVHKKTQKKRSNEVVLCRLAPSSENLVYSNIKVVLTFITFYCFKYICRVKALHITCIRNESLLWCVERKRSTKRLSCVFLRGYTHGWTLNELNRARSGSRMRQMETGSHLEEIIAVHEVINKFMFKSYSHRFRLC